MEADIHFSMELFCTYPLLNLLNQYKIQMSMARRCIEYFEGQVEY